MSKWEKVKLTKLCQINIGKTPSRNEMIFWDNGAYNWLSISDIKGKYLSDTKEKITDTAIKQCNMKLISANTVIMSFKLSVGKVGIISESMYSNEAIANFPILSLDRLDINFLYYVLQTLKFENMDRAAKGLTLNKAKLNQIEIPLPPLEVQKKIAKTLDAASELIVLRKKQLAELDNLSKSIFYDMFGDPVVNEKGWELKALGRIASKIGSGATPRGGKNSYKATGISLIRSMNVHNGIFRYDQLAYLDEEQASELKNVIVKNNDVLINITGASVARSCVVPADVLPARVNQHVSIVRIPNTVATSSYINNVFTSDSYQKKLLSIAGAGGATREAITKNQLQEFPIPLPPLPLQYQFAEIVTKIEEQKALVQKALDESQYLFDSLMSKYFD